MKKNLFIASLLLLTSHFVFSQGTRIGLRFAPSVAFNSVFDKNEKDGLQLNSGGIGVRYSAGIISDFFFGENYAFSTGLWFTTKRSAISAEVLSAKQKLVYNGQYLQIPLTIKLYTNEIATDMKLYFQLGVTADLKIAEKIVKWPGDDSLKPSSPQALRFFDSSLLLGAGIEMRMGENTSFFGGLSYNRGLINASTKKGLFNDPTKKANDMYRINNQLINIDMGIKF